MFLKERYTSVFKSLLGVFLLASLITSCTKDEFEPTGPNRLFRPTVKGEMRSNGNWIEASWQKVKGATSYTVQLSRDTFKTFDATVKVDTNFIRFEDLRWNHLYQIRVKAEAADTTMNSRYSDLGEMKSAKFPTIITPVVSEDVIDAALILRWTNSGSDVTSIKVLSADSTLVKEVALSPTDLTNQFKRVTGLTGNTDYIVYLYSGDDIRGWENVSTKAPLVFKTGSNIVDIRGNDDPLILRQTLSGGLPSGSVVLLDRGMTYTLNSTIALSGSLTLVSGLGFGPVAEVIIDNNFDFAAGSTIDSVKFRDLTLKGVSNTGDYVFNPNVSGVTVGKIAFENCNISTFRGVSRFRGTTTVNNITYNNCIISDINDYNVLTVDDVNSKVLNFELTNSTVYKVQGLIVSRSNANSVTIDHVTFNEIPKGGAYLIYYRTSGSDNVTNGIKVHNSILGVGYNFQAGGTNVFGVRGNSNNNVDAMGTYYTSDYTATNYQIPGLIPYSGTSTDLFTDPANGDFSFKDTGFAGKNTAGDPRWKR